MIGNTSLFDKHKNNLLLFFVFGSVISIYHIGIEQGIFSESLLCELGLNSNIQNGKERSIFSGKIGVLNKQDIRI